MLTESADYADQLKRELADELQAQKLPPGKQPKLPESDKQEVAQSLSQCRKTTDDDEEKSDETDIDDDTYEQVQSFQALDDDLFPCSQIIR